MFTRQGCHYLLIDTAGIRRRGKVKDAVEKFSVMKALRSLDRCHVALLMIDAEKGVTDQDARIGSYALDKGRAVVILVNKWDLVRDRFESPESFLEEALYRLPHLRFAPILPVSALTGYNLQKALARVQRVEKAFHMHIPTGPLNKLLEDAVKAHTPPSDGTHVRRFNYITQIKQGPPTFLVFSNRSQPNHLSYQRYLIHKIRNRFGFEGVPIRLVFRKKR